MFLSILNERTVWFCCRIIFEEFLTHFPTDSKKDSDESRRSDKNGEWEFVHCNVIENETCRNWKVVHSMLLPIYNITEVIGMWWFSLRVFFGFLCDDNMVKLFAVSCKCEFIQDEILSIEFIEIIMSFWCIRLQINVGMWVCVNINIANYLPINHIVYYRRIADMMSECIAIELIEWPNKQGQTITDNTN